MSNTLNKKEATIDHKMHQNHHNALHAALRVKITRDEETERALDFNDADPTHYNLFRGHGWGEGHADRLLDDKLCRVRQGAELNKCFCDEYTPFLKKEKAYTDLPTLCLRRRLYKNICA